MPPGSLITYSVSVHARESPDGTTDRSAFLVGAFSRPLVGRLVMSREAA